MDQDNAYTLLHLTDTHLMADAKSTLLGYNTADSFQKTLATAVTEQPPADLILLTGDLAQEPTAESYRFLLDALSPLQIPCLCLPGNHDDLALMQATLATHLVHCRKHVILGPWQLIALNSQVQGSPAGFLADEELSFLQQRLQAHPDHHSVVAVHHHCLPTHSAWMDSMMIANHEAFLAVLAQHPRAKLVVNGHIHQAMDRMSDATRVLATPSTCFQFAPYSSAFKIDGMSPSYRTIQLFSDGIVATQVHYLSERAAGLITDKHGY